MVGTEIPERAPSRCGVAGRLQLLLVAQVDDRTHLDFVRKGRNRWWRTGLPDVAVVAVHLDVSYCLPCLDFVTENLGCSWTGLQSLSCLIDSTEYQLTVNYARC